jgi:acetolactate synthase-1/3 small subunit
MPRSEPLLQVRCSASQRSELRDVIEIFRASIVDISHGTMTLEVQGKDDKMKALCDLLEPYGGGRGWQGAAAGADDDDT